MRYLQLYENFDDIKRICERYDINNYIINQDETVDVDNDVDLDSRQLYKLPLKFGKVSGYFVCDNNLLSSLDGSPREIGSTGFGCGNNVIKTLVGGPLIVKGIYYCHDNELTDVVGFPEHYTDNNVYATGNPVSEILNLVKEYDQAKFIKWLNEYDVIRDGCRIVEMRLEEAYYMTTKKELVLKKSERQFKNYRLI